MPPFASSSLSLPPSLLTPVLCLGSISLFHLIPSLIPPPSVYYPDRYLFLILLLFVFFLPPPSSLYSTFLSWFWFICTVLPFCHHSLNLLTIFSYPSFLTFNWSKGGSYKSSSVSYDVVGCMFFVCEFKWRQTICHTEMEKTDLKWLWSLPLCFGSVIGCYCLDRKNQLFHCGDFRTKIHPAQSGGLNSLTWRIKGTINGLSFVFWAQ